MRNATFTGRVTRDWEKKATKDGKPFWVNSLAVNKPNNETLWVSLSVWNEKQADTLSKWAKSGDYLSVSGDVDCRAYTANDGTPKAEMQIRVSGFTPIFSKKEEGTSHAPAKKEDYLDGDSIEF